MKTKNIDNCAIVTKASDGALTAVASTATLDRDGEVMLPSSFGKHLDRYRANPVILAAHTHRSTDGGPTIIGSASRIEVVENELVFEMCFARTPLAQQWQSLYEDGHAKAFSVGFIPLAGKWQEASDAQNSVYVHTEVELIEISAVAVPANPDALSRGVSTEELESMIDARVKKALERMYAIQMLKLLK